MSDRDNSWLIKGKYYGYPVCCIKSFVELKHLKKEWPNKFAGTGYIPCEACAKHLTMLEMQANINANRDKGLAPFPATI